MNYILEALRVFDSQRSGLQHVKSHLNNEFENAVDAILKTDGKVVLCGVDKSGLAIRLLDLVIWPLDLIIWQSKNVYLVLEK